MSIGSWFQALGPATVNTQVPKCAIGLSGLSNEQCFASPPTQYRLYGRPNSVKVLKKHIVHRQIKHTISRHINKNTANPLVYTNMGWLGDGSHRGQVRHAWTAMGLLLRYPHQSVWQEQTTKLPRVTDQSLSAADKCDLSTEVSDDECNVGHNTSSHEMSCNTSRWIQFSKNKCQNITSPPTQYRLYERRVMSSTLLLLAMHIMYSWHHDIFYLDNSGFYGSVRMLDTVQYASRHIAHTLHYVCIHLYVGKLRLHIKYTSKTRPALK